MNLTFKGACIANILAEYNQQDATLLNLLISIRRSACFRRGFPSIIRRSKLHIQRQVFVRPIVLPAASSNGLTNVLRCVCSFELLMMDGKTSETCRGSYRNK